MVFLLLNRVLTLIVVFVLRCISGSLKCFFAKGVGEARGLCLCWNDLNINLVVLAHNSIFIHCEVTEKCSDRQFLLTCVYDYPQKSSDPSCGTKFFLWFQVIISTNLGCF